MGAATLAISEGDGWGWSDPRIVVAALASPVLGALFLARCRSHPSPVLDLSLFRARAFAVANLATRPTRWASSPCCSATSCS
jgi:hypothetical protein